MNKNMIKLLVLAAVYLAAVTRPSYAYLDPGTASILLQSVIGAFVAGAATVGLYWSRFKGFFRKRERRDEMKKD